MEPKLIKIDRNGSKHFEGLMACDRCGGAGYYAIGVNNGAPVLSPLDHGVCWKCGGAGKVRGTWIERTPEYQAKLDARRAARQQAKEAEWARQQAAAEAERMEREAREQAEREKREAEIKALKARSQYVGTAGEKLDIIATYTGTASYTVKSFSGYGTDTVYVHMFRDADENKLVWRTSKALVHMVGHSWEPIYEEGDTVALKGTIKEHKEYRDEKQTMLIRCKVERSEA